MSESESGDTKTVPVPMVGPEIVKQLRALHAMGWGTKRIAGELGISRNSVRRYLRGGVAAETQTRPAGRCPTSRRHSRADSSNEAQGNGVVVQRLLAERDVEVPLRSASLHRVGREARSRTRDGAVRDARGTRCRSISASAS